MDESVIYCRFITGKICAREVKINYQANVTKCPIVADKRKIEFQALPETEFGEVVLSLTNQGHKEQMFERTSPDFSPWIAINANNKMIARLTALRFLLNQTDYENKKLLKPLTWSKNINNYKVLLEGVEFSNLDYEQYQVLSKYMDDD